MQHQNLTKFIMLHQWHTYIELKNTYTIIAVIIIVIIIIILYYDCVAMKNKMNAISRLWCCGWC